MTKDQLVNAIRQEEVKAGTDQTVLANVSDEELIDTYRRCPECGGLLVDDEELPKITELALDLEHFLDLANTFPAAYSRREIGHEHNLHMN